MLGKKNMLPCTYSGAKCKSQYVGVLWTALRALASFSFFFFLIKSEETDEQSQLRSCICELRVEIRT